MRNRNTRRLTESLFSKVISRVGPFSLPGSIPPRDESSSEGVHFISDELMRFLAEFNVDSERANAKRDNENEALARELERQANELSAAAIRQARHRSKVVINLAKAGYAPRLIDSSSSKGAPRAERIRPGAFEAFMLDRPGLAAKLRSRCTKELGRSHEPSLRGLHKEFLTCLRLEYGVAAHEYPFVLVGGGYRSFCRWVQRVRLLDGEGQQ
jgi:hypothetical protein